MDRDANVDADAIIERAWIEYREPATARVETPVWVAEDPESGCLALGDLRIEAEGNLVAAVREYRQSPADTPILKTRGRSVTRPGVEDSSKSTFESLLPWR